MEVSGIASQSPSPERSIPSQYQVRRCLGEGGCGQVFEAWDLKLCRSVALKQLKPKATSLRAGSLMREARLAASLKHAAFVKVYSVEGDGDTQSIIMELVEGNTLRRHLQQGQLPADELLGIVYQVAEAMQEAHGSGLVHGDLKPSNLMVEQSGRVRILDFGLARQIDPQATQSIAFEDTEGTIAYMAPERMTGAPASAQTDIYALGVILYEMLTGACPFAELKGLALAAAHLQSSSAQWPFPKEADPAIAAMIRSMTARDTAARLASMQAVCAELAVPREGSPTLATQPAAPERHWRFGRLSLRTRVVAAGMACTALIGAGLWAAVQTVDWAWVFSPPYSEADAMRTGMEALRVFDRDGSLELAERNFNSVIEHNPGSGGAAAGLSLVYSLRYTNDGRDEVWLQRADADAQQALKLDDQLALAYAASALVKKMQGHNAEALAAENKALSLDPLNLFALDGKAILQIDTRQFEDAERTIQSAIAAHPKERLFTDLLGTLRYQQANYAEAEQAFRRSLALDPDAPYAYANLNAALLRQNRADEALQALQQGLQIRPNGRLYTNLGTTLFARGDYAGAALAFEHAVSSAKGSPNDYLKWANLADALRWIPGREEASRQAYLRATQLLAPLLEREPGNAMRLSRIGLYSAHLGDKQAASSWTQRALDAAPTGADIQFRAAVASELVGQHDLAVDHLIRAKTLGYPGNLIDSEPDLVATRRDSRYQTLLLESAK